MALKAGRYGVTKEQLLKIDSGGGGGTTVVANPEGAATADLTKLKVGDTIYGVEGDTSACYQTTDDTESAIVDADYIPFLDSSAASGAGAPKKSTWSNFVSKIQSKLTAFVDWSSYVKTGVHNLINVDTYITAGATATSSGNGYIIEGEAATAYPYVKFSKKFPAGTYKISLTLADVSLPTGDKIIIGLRKANNSFESEYIQATEAGNYEATVTTTEETTLQVLPKTDSTTIASSVKVTNIMVRFASDTDTTYAPYAMTNTELTEIKTGTVSEYTNSYASFNTSSAYLVSRAGIKKLYMFVTISAAASSDDWIQIATLSEAPTKVIAGINVPWDSALGSTRSFVYQIDTDGKVYIRAKAEMSSIISETFI